MLACHCEYRITKQRIDRLDRPAGYDGNRVAHQPPQGAQYLR